MTVHVRLLDEGVDTWRPVPATRLSASTFRLSAAAPPEGERWSFGPGEVVVAERREGSAAFVAVARATDFDAPSQASLALAS